MTDLMIRGAAIGTILTCALICAMFGRGSARLSVGAFAGLITCYLIVSAPGSGALPHALRGALTLGAMAAPLGLTWMMLDLLSDRDLPRWPWLGLAGATVAASLAAWAWPVLALLRGGMVIALYLGLIWLAVVSDRGDLVAARRRFRRGFLAVMGVAGVAISIVETTASEAKLQDWVFLAQSGAFWALGLGFAGWALRMDSDLFAALPPAEHQSPPPRPDLIARLERAMAAGLWQREGLTIGRLAAELGVPEHQLRATINRQLGHRNFATYINGHRIAAAKAQLRDPALAGKTILEIAYEVGFASLGPFNKAFRAQTGQSPSAYRAEADIQR